MSRLPAHNVYELNAGIIIVLTSTLSNICSLLTLYIIYKTGRWNAYVQIIISMTICQLLYDISFYLLISDTPTAFYTQEFISYFMGTSVSLWTNVISSIVMYLVVSRQSMDVTRYYPYFFFGCIVVPFFLALIFTVLTIEAHKDIGENAYIIIRLISIGYNIVAYIVVARHLKEIGSSSLMRSTRTPLLILSSRIKYYPLVQVLSRAWPTYYELHYGFSKVHDKVFAVNSTEDIVALYLDAFFLPLAGIGYFFVYLAMQPQAWRIFKEMLFCAEPDAMPNGGPRHTTGDYASGIYSRLGNDELEPHRESFLGTGTRQTDETYSTAIIDQSDKDSAFSAGHLIVRSAHNRISNYDDMDELELEEEIASYAESQQASSYYPSSTSSSVRSPSHVVNVAVGSEEEGEEDASHDIPSIFEFRTKSSISKGTTSRTPSIANSKRSRSSSRAISSKGSHVGVQRARSPQPSDDASFL